ncbi:hypothetical protein [Hymenobacter weizhouensis]|uniref:hypothetical protein n=1 Tax=Hymenobacter sp. YIM 151500-1 TaxID=2987689 RepID=UPI00222805D0|nr:hypothetical protein [Hymenobacter sp. YIM 151500-1]UYZ64640.1 hypothetical protein OIS53_07260 [Hymenobacter sp. YIM 151500-1]
MHNKPNRYAGLEIDAEDEFQRRSYRVQRVAWVVLALVVVAGLLGLFGSGPLSHAQATHPGGRLRVEYERFGRLDAPLLTKVFVAPGTADADGRVRLWVSKDYLNRVAGDGLSPIPEATLTAADHVVFVFRLTDARQPVDVTFYLSTEKTGFLRGKIGLVGRPDTLSIRQFIYP